MRLVTKFVRVGAYLQELTTIESQGFLRDLLNTLYLHLQKTCGYQTKAGDDLTGEVLIFKVTQNFDHVTNVSSSEKLKKLYLHFQKIMATKLGKVLISGSSFRTQALKQSQTSFYYRRNKVNNTNGLKNKVKQRNTWNTKVTLVTVSNTHHNKSEFLLQ